MGPYCSMGQPRFEHKEWAKVQKNQRVSQIQWEAHTRAKLGAWYTFHSIYEIMRQVAEADIMPQMLAPPPDLWWGHI